MKKTYILFAVIFAAIASIFSVQAQTEVTSTYLTNADFNTSCNYLTADPTSNLGSANGGVNIKDVTGWTKGLTGDNSAAASYEYGFVGTLNVSGTYGFIPAAGPDAATGTGQGALGISAAWGASVTYYQTITLPIGKYRIDYAAFNSGPNAADYSKVGWIPSTGTSVISSKTSFTMNAWDTESLEITVTSETTGKIQVGISCPNVGSGSVGRIFFDYVKIFVLPVDKTNLQTLLTSANTLAADPQDVGTSTAYTDLNSAITAAQLVYDNADATSADVLTQEGLLQSAITNVNNAIVIQQRVLAWSTLPYDVTSVIVNPSFESNNTNGWTNVGGFAMQNNTSFSYKAGTYYVEKWQASGNWTGLKLSQKIVALPNGIYKLTVGALNNPNTTGGAFVYANDQKQEVFATNDYTILVTVTNNQLEIGYEVTNGGNYVAVDNFRLTYVSDGSPYVVLAPPTLFFTPSSLTKTFTVTGGNLTSDLTLTAPAGISLDINTLTAAQVAAGATITATFDNATAISNGSITATSGSLTQSITVNASADLNCFTPLYSSLTNLIPDPYMNDISGFGGWGHKSVVLGQAYCGAACVKMDAVTNTYPDGAALDVSTVNWEPNSTYRLHAWVKTLDGSFAFLAKNTNPDVLISVPMTGDVWTEIDQTFTTGAAPTASFFTFNNVDGASTGKVAYIDNYELYNITSVLTGVNKLAVNKAFSSYVSDNKIVAKFELVSNAEVTLSVYNVDGMLIESNKAACVAGSNVKTFNALLPSGVYIVRMSANGKVFTQKVIK